MKECFRFREHREYLEDSMKTLVTLDSFDALVSYIQKSLEPFRFKVDAKDIQVTPYMLYPDKRINWPVTYLVILEGYGVIGMTDGPVEKETI